MLKNEIDKSIDLEDEKWSLEEKLPSDILNYFSENDVIWKLNYPVDQFPKKVKSLSFDKTPIIVGTLVGIKGQYLIFDNDCVLAYIKHTGYFVNIH